MFVIHPRWARCVLVLAIYLVIFNQSAWAAILITVRFLRAALESKRCVFTLTPSSNCVNYVNKPLKHREQLAIVAKHNEYRQRVASGQETRGNPGAQPPASNMKQLTWDHELAKIAQRYADQCIKGHDKCRNIAKYQVGQNIATEWSTNAITTPLEELVTMWYNEVDIFSKRNVERFQFAKPWGHYSQLVWGETSKVGCGVVRYWDTSKRMNTLTLICNYGPTGNFAKQSVYKIGAPASACPAGPSIMAGLCN